MTTKSIIIIDDHKLFAGGIELMLKRVDTNNVCQIFEDPNDFLAAADSKTSPDLIIVDYYIPGCDPVSLITTLRQRFPDAGILILSASLSPIDRQQGLTAGADAFVNKHVDTTALLNTVQSLLAKKPVSSDPSPTPEIAQKHSLSARQFDVLVLVSKGCSNKEIAGLLGISPETVKSHLQTIYLRFAVKNRIEAVEYARNYGLA